MSAEQHLTRSGAPSLDWHGGEAATMELSHLLITRVTKRRPSHDLQARFAFYVLRRLPEGGFVLDSEDLARWLRVAGDGQASAPEPPPRRSWLSRRRAGLGDPPSHSTDA
jgi:hypothetical protein